MSLRRPPRDQQPITTDAALTALWRTVLGTETYQVRTIWLLFLDPARRPAGPVITVDDVPDGPYDLQVADLVIICREILDGPGGGIPGGGTGGVPGGGAIGGTGGGGSVALLMSRPGGMPWTVSDRAWGRFLDRAASAVGGTVWPAHRAHRYGVDVVPVPRRPGQDVA